jgi:hypothetical protein
MTRQPVRIVPGLVSLSVFALLSVAVIATEVRSEDISAAVSELQNQASRRHSSASPLLFRAVTFVRYFADAGRRESSTNLEHGGPETDSGFGYL